MGKVQKSLRAVARHTGKLAVRYSRPSLARIAAHYAIQSEQI